MARPMQFLADSASIDTEPVRFDTLAAVNELYSEDEERMDTSQTRILDLEDMKHLLIRAALGDDQEEVKEEKEQPSNSRKQMEESRLRLNKLRRDGFEFVTNVQVACDAREAIRRTEEDEAKRLRKERLEQEAKSGAERFDDITRKWEQALQRQIPQQLFEMLMAQKMSCDTMIEEKNKLINDFQQELKSKDDQYVKDLKKMSEDIDMLIERMQEQLKSLIKASREELEEIDRAYMSERNVLLEQQRKKWEDKMQYRRDKEADYLKQREKRVEECEKQLQHLRVSDAEEYNMVKIRLETDVQVMEQQLQQMRATYQLNQEKLEYNFQVLKKRDEENTITKSQQKRKITRLQDVLNGLRVRLAKQEKMYREENSQLADDYKRITEQFRDLQRKSKHFMATDAKKFAEVWCMNEDECRKLLQGVMDADRVIYEQQLGLKWEPPDLQFLATKGPLTAEMTQKPIITAQQVVQEVFVSTATTDSQGGAEGQTDQALKPTIFSRISRKTIKQILELLCDESGFLIEGKLNTLLAPLEKNERSLIKLDAIFTALKIDTEEDIHTLSTYFLDLKGTNPPEEKTDKGTEKSKKTTPRSADQQDQGVLIDRDRLKLIHPNEVYKALRSFVEDHRKPVKKRLTQEEREQLMKSTSFKLTVTDHRDDSHDSVYWAKYGLALTDKKERLWQGLLQGLQKYNDVLHGRANSLLQTEALKQQNAELRMLLYQYVNSKVNTELEIPPNHVLQLEFNQK